MMPSVNLISPKLQPQRNSQLKPLGKELRISKHAINNARDVLMQANIKPSTRSESMRGKEFFGMSSNSANSL